MTSSELCSPHVISVVTIVRRDRGVVFESQDMRSRLTPGGEVIGMGRLDLCGVSGVTARIRLTLEH